MHLKNSSENIKRIRYLFSGMVQGVGFRPFVYRLAVKKGLNGFVQNRSDGVIAEVEGPSVVADSFLADIRRELPPLACITNIACTNLEIRHDRDFQISQATQKVMRTCTSHPMLPPVPIAFKNSSNPQTGVFAIHSLTVPTAVRA